jgi:hypothetical protein
MRTSKPVVHGFRIAVFLVGLTVASPAVNLYAQAPKAPAPAKPPAAKPAAKPAPPKPAAKPTPAAVAQPAPPPPSDVRFASKYTTGDQVTESVTYLHGARERYELGDMILLRQHDQNRTVQISRASNTYLVSPEGLPASAPPAATTPPAPGQKAPGTIVIATTIVDTGERKAAFGQQARHVKTMIDKQPQPGACDQSKGRIETDGWYIDLPKAISAQPQGDDAAPAGTCHDEIKTTENGDATALGFPIGYTTTSTSGDGKAGTDAKADVVTMEVTDFQVTKLDAALFEIPQGPPPMTAAMNLQELSKAISDANEVKLAAGDLPAGMAREKKAGTIRIGVPDVANKTTQEVDTRALRTRLIAELADAKMEGVPLAAAPQAQLDARAAELGCDYLLIAEVTELKASKPGGITRMMKATAGDGAGKDVTEAKMTVRLTPPAGKARLSTTTSGKDGGVGVKTGLGLVRVAGTLYLKMMTGGMYGSPLSAMNAASMMNIGGMGMLGNPALMGSMGSGRKMDRTAGAASFLMQQAMTGSSAGPGSGPSFDSALGDAVQDAAKNVVDNLKKK